MKDRIGIGWRPELAAGILSNLGDIDVIEVMADDFFEASSRQLRAIQTLAVQVPVVLHGVSLGLGSSTPVDQSRLDKFARVAAAIQPKFWSEHLAFVRSDGVEIGHLAAAPRIDATIEGTTRNLERAETTIGTRPLVENIATLIDPPGSVYDEATWISNILTASNCDLLLDLNNLYANAVNFGHQPRDLLDHLPLERVSAVHLAGGKWISASKGERRLLDDHLHDVPDVVYGLLTEVGAKTARPLTVILERDGAYPPFEQLMAQLDRARDALAAGRIRAVEQTIMKACPRAVAAGAPYRAPSFESYLARLYVDREARDRFLADPRGEAERAGFYSVECDALIGIDRVGLELASHSFERKRKQQKRRPPGRSLRRFAENLFGRGQRR